jgi:hypothetical protein
MKSIVLMVFFAIFVTLALMTTPANAAGAFDIDWFVIGNGGGISNTGNLSLRSTIGQPFVGHCQNSDLELCSGFWCRILAQYKLFLPLILGN